MNQSCKILDLLKLIRAQIQEGQIWQRDKVFKLVNLIVLEVQALDLLLSLQEWDVFESSGVKLHLLSILFSLSRPSINDHDPRDLWQLNIEVVGLLLNEVEVTMPQQVPVAVILLLVQ
jgi:hypothetical protein